MLYFLLQTGGCHTKMGLKFILPCYIPQGKKNVPINLNWYRNAHYQTSNNIKRKFKEHIAPQFKGLEAITAQISIHFTYYAARNNSPDLDNFTSVSKKFFQDAMVELGLIADDNVNYIVATSESYGGLDRDNPRVEAEITITENNA
jgi:Holliday junction resolvase RusA-like endonuclease